MCAASSPRWEILQPAPAPDSGGVISGVRVVERITLLLVDIRRRNYGDVLVNGRQRAAWTKSVMRLIYRKLRPREFACLRVLGVVEWYADQPNWRVDPYIPRVDGGKSLYEKFERLELCMHVRTGDRHPDVPTVDCVISRLFNGSAVLAETFRGDILVRARRLDLGGESEAVLAGAVGNLYSAVQRQHRPGVSTVGAMNLVRRYLIWLGEKDWQMTLRVLDIESPAFVKFRRGVAAMHPYGADPLTGR